MNAVLTVVGKDMVGILAKVSVICADNHVNIEEVSQSILRNTFAMIMMVNVEKSKVEFTKLTKLLEDAGKEMGVDIHVTRQELFDAMHRI